MAKREKLTKLPEAVEKKITDILNRGKDVEVAIRGGKLVVWGKSNTKEYEATV